MRYETWTMRHELWDMIYKIWALRNNHICITKFVQISMFCNKSFHLPFYLKCQFYCKERNLLGVNHCNSCWHPKSQILKQIWSLIGITCLSKKLDSRHCEVLYCTGWKYLKFLHCTKFIVDSSTLVINFTQT